MIRQTYMSYTSTGCFILVSVLVAAWRILNKVMYYWYQYRCRYYSTSTYITTTSTTSTISVQLYRQCACHEKLKSDSVLPGRTSTSVLVLAITYY
jgi:hypothetical protein